MLPYLIQSLVASLTVFKCSKFIILFNLVVFIDVFILESSCYTMLFFFYFLEFNVGNQENESTELPSVWCSVE